ncbi:hypothetical protein ABIB90_006561 [Bradyrhizobium sp. JR4.1]|uniref:hypothetical protein n=1 Tax=Bradyrhizobium sp. JR4.1 TaxID=3156372 RepID=UPI003399E5AF
MNKGTNILLRHPMTTTPTRLAVFFDRDGVLNHDTSYLFEAAKFKWMDGAREAVRLVNEAGYFAFVVTTQSGVARGFYEESDVQRPPPLDDSGARRGQRVYRCVRILCQSAL